MPTLNRLLDKAKDLCGSDLATAAKMGVSRSAVSKWRKGQRIEPDHVARLVELTQQDPALAVQVLSEQGGNPAEVRLWGALWDRLSPVTTKVAGVLLLLAVLQHPASASPVAFPLADLNDGHGMHYAKKVRGWLTALMGRWRAAWRSHAASPVLA